MSRVAISKITNCDFNQPTGSVGERQRRGLSKVAICDLKREQD